MYLFYNVYTILRKDLPWGEDIHRDVEIDDITDGRPTVLALHTVHRLILTSKITFCEYQCSF